MTPGTTTGTTTETSSPSQQPMPGVAQFGIAIGVLGVVVAFMGLFPSVTGIVPGQGVGLVQFMAILSGFILLHLGAILYIKFTFYVGRLSTLVQQVGVRLSMTGLIFMAMAGLADFLGFGSHLRTPETSGVVGPLQAFGIMGGIIMAAVGVLIYVLAGPAPTLPARSSDDI